MRTKLDTLLDWWYEGGVSGESIASAHGANMPAAILYPVPRHGLHIPARQTSTLKLDPIVLHVSHWPIPIYQGTLASAMLNGVFGAHPRWPLRVTRRALVRTATEVARGMLHLHEAGECQHVSSDTCPIGCVSRRALVRTAAEVAHGMLHLHEAGE